nr:hypothetical protein [uncultured Flavobacterium sp.]
MGAFVFNILAFLNFRITVSPDNLSPIFPNVGFAIVAVLIIEGKTIVGVWVGLFVVANSDYLHKKLEA